MKVYKFNNCYLDTIERRVFKNGQLIEITPRAFDILQLLVENPGKVVTKAVLIEKVWRDSFVEEGNIPVHISKLRKILGANKTEPLIETVSGAGYQLVSRVTTVSEDDWERYLAENIKPSRASGSKRTSLDSIACLPFQNISHSKEFEYLAEGLTENIINHLSYVPELKVIARNTVFRFKDSQMDAREIGEMLSVAAVLTGRIRVIGENILVGVELVKTSDGTQIWGQQFHQPFSDIFEIQGKIALSISEKLRLQISEIDKNFLGQPSQNIKAYTQYLKGRHFWIRKNVADINTAIKYFQDSISIDPNYIPSYIGLGDCYISLYTHEELPRNKALSLVNTILDNLAEFKKNDSEILLLKGSAKLYLEWDWKSAEHCFQQSLSLNSINSISLSRYALLLALKGHFAESLLRHQQALQLDPLSIMTNTSLGKIFYFMEQYDNALRQLRETLELDPTNYVAQGLVGITLAAQGNYEESLNTFRTAQKLGTTVELDSCIGYVQALSGAKNKAREKIIEIEYQINTRGLEATNVAYIYVALREFDKALECLERAYQQRSQELIGIKVDPRLKPIRHYPKFQNLVRRIGMDSD